MRAMARADNGEVLRYSKEGLYVIDGGEPDAAIHHQQLENRHPVLPIGRWYQSLAECNGNVRNDGVTFSLVITREGG